MSSEAFCLTLTASCMLAARPCLALSRRFPDSSSGASAQVHHQHDAPPAPTHRSDLALLGLQVALEDVYTPAALAHDFLARRNLAPFLVVHPELREDFSGLRTDGEKAVVVGDAGEFFTYDLLNRAYRKILQGAEFLALAKNRNFLDHDGELSLDAGPFVAGLEYASGRAATVLGKPAPTFFKLAVEGLRCAAEDVAMIGDDAEADVGGAMAAGLMGVLVQTGKYRPGQEALLADRPTLVAKNLKVAVDLLLS